MPTVLACTLAMAGRLATQCLRLVAQCHKDRYVTELSIKYNRGGGERERERERQRQRQRERERKEGHPYTHFTTVSPNKISYNKLPTEIRKDKHLSSHRQQKYLDLDIVYANKNLMTARYIPNGCQVYVYSHIVDGTAGGERERERERERKREH